MTLESTINAAMLAIARSAVADTIAASHGRIAAAFLGGIAVAVLVTASIVCATTALWIWGIPWLSPAGSALAVAGVLLLACVAVLAVMRETLQRRRTVPPFDATPALLLAEATHLFRNHKGTVLMAALIAGLEAGRDNR